MLVLDVRQVLRVTVQVVPESFADPRCTIPNFFDNHAV